jgi:signal transduction histidine kinase
VVGATAAVPAGAAPYRVIDLSLLGRPLRLDVYPGTGAEWQTGWIPGLAAGALIAAIAVLVYIMGVVNRRRSIEQEERVRLAREIAQDKDRFIAAISHELRTPLTSVVGLADELSAGMGDFELDQIHELISIMAQESGEVALLVEDLLVAARAEGGMVVIRPEIVDVDLEVARVRAAIEADGNIVTPQSHVSVWADPLRLRQILRNLITNGLRHGGPIVEVSASTDGRKTIIEVRDNGAGITGEARTRMFEPYYRSAAVRGQAPSVGLGLAVSYQLARLMDGQLSYEHINGWGVFRLEFPAVMIGTPRVPRLSDPVSD